MTKGVDERINEDVLWWFDHVERMEKARIAKIIYVRECAGSHSVGTQRKRWIDSVKDCLKRFGCWAYNLKGIKENIYFFSLSFVSLLV